MSDKHISYFDFLRGIAILMVVAIHTYVAGNFDTLDGIIRIVFRQILNCAVPIFLALSGFFLGRKTFGSKVAVFKFWKHQIPKVYIPCLVWSIPLCFLRTGASIEHQLFVTLFCGASVYYYIALIIQYYLLLPILQIRPKLNLVLSILISFISILVVTFLLSVKGISLPLLIYAGPFVVWLVFYMLGVFYSKTQRTYSIKQACLFVILGFILSILETYYWQTYYTGGIGIKLSAFIYAYGIILLILSQKAEQSYRENWFTSTIAFIGQISFGIYLIHCYLINLLNSINPCNIWCIKWFLTSLLTIVIIIICRKILPSSILKYIGFK